MAGPLPLSLLPDTAEVLASGSLAVGGLEVTQLAEEFGTPLFVYDEQHLRNRCRESVSAWGEGVAYASKAFLCKAMARLAHEEGMMIDIATGGELFVTLESGVPAKRLIFHGNNKTNAEIQTAIEVGVAAIVVDSFDEIDRIDALVAAGSRVPNVMVRITPGVKAETHKYVQTGQDDSKFGFTVSTGDALAAIERVQAATSMNLVGVHAHIGSQVFRKESFQQAAAVMAQFVAPFRLQEFSVGGGLGVPYVEGETAPTITEWAEAVITECRSRGMLANISAEPGRSIVATAGMTLYSVGTIKDLPDIREYIAVDGGFGDNPRPVLYGSGYEAFLPRSVAAERPRQATVVGMHCESSDQIVPDAWLPYDVAIGDILATPVTGAYGHAMGSNYNKVLRPAVVFVMEGKARLVIRRETLEDLVRADL